MKSVFYLSDQGLGVYSSHCQTFKEPKFFSWEQTQEIEEWLAQLPRKQEVSLVVDLVDEDITLEASPKLYLWERSAVQKSLVERLQSDGADYVQTQWTGINQTSSDGRAEELLLSASIAAPAHITHFIGALEEAEVVVRGMYSVPFLIAEYVKKYLKPAFGLSKSQFQSPYFLITRQSDESYRQTFFFEGQLRISRLIEIDKKRDDYAAIQSALIHEAKLARNYVHNQNLTREHLPIGYVFLDSDEQRLEGLQQRCLNEGLIVSEEELNHALFKTATFDSIGYEATLCGVTPEQYYGAQAMADYVLNDAPKPFYQNSYIRTTNALLSGYKGLLAVNTVLFLALIVYSVFFGIDTYLSQHKLALLDEQIQNHKVEKERLQEEVDLQFDAKEIKASVDFSEAILNLKKDRTVGFDANPVSAVFARHEHIQLVNLGWKQLDRFDSLLYEVELDGWVFPFEDYYREPVQWVDALIEDIKTLPYASSVVLIQEPLNRNLQQALTVKIGDKTVKALPFKIKMRIGHVESK